MKPTQALELIMQVTQQYKGNRKDHERLQQAEVVLMQLIKPVEEPKNAKSNK